MSAGLGVLGGAGAARAADPPGGRWLLPGLTAALAAAAAYQLVYLAPRCMWAMQRAGARPSWTLRLVRGVPEWAAAPAVLAAVAAAVWLRGSVRRSAALATAALAVNVAGLGCLLGNLA